MFVSLDQAQLFLLGYRVPGYLDFKGCKVLANITDNREACTAEFLPDKGSVLR